MACPLVFPLPVRWDDASAKVIRTMVESLATLAPRELTYVLELCGAERFFEIKGTDAAVERIRRYLVVEERFAQYEQPKLRRTRTFHVASCDGRPAIELRSTILTVNKKTVVHFTVLRWKRLELYDFAYPD